MSSRLVERAAEHLARADFVLIAAGAGMSVDAGLDYAERERFGRRYPDLGTIGVRCRYDSIGFPWPSPSVQWAFYARHLRDVLDTPPSNPAPYRDADRATRHADRWVLTSNADDLFVRHGFAPDRIWTRQGRYAFLQCLRPCAEEVWPSRPAMRALLACVDPRTGALGDPALVPRCPRCGGEVFLNVRGGDWFVERHYLEEGARLERWLAGARGGRLVVLDVGTGFSTPSVIRWPVERLVASHPDAHLIRVNPVHPQVPRALGAAATPLAVSGGEFFARAAAAAARPAGGDVHGPGVPASTAPASTAKDGNA